MEAGLKKEDESRKESERLTESKHIDEVRTPTLLWRKLNVQGSEVSYESVVFVQAKTFFVVLRNVH